MHRLAIVLVLLAACHKTKSATPTAGSGSSSGVDPNSAAFSKRVTLTWGIAKADKGTDVFLAATDERGEQVSHPLGNFPGTCTPVTPAPDMQALIALDCKDGATGLELQAIDRRDRVLVLKLRIDDGVTPDAMAREQIGEVEVPLGAKIEAGKL